MKTHVISGWLCLLTSVVFSQSKLTGYVTEQNSGKNLVSDVQIKATGANPITSEAKGNFVLTFQGYDVGEVVVVRPEKVGWELVNEKEMKTILPAKPNESPLKIIMCKAGTLAAAKQAYYKVVDPYIIQQFNLKLTALNKEKASYQAEKTKLQEERNRLQSQLDEYAEEFIRTNPDDISDIERRAIALFKEGKIEESIKLRESLKSGLEIKNAVQRKAKEDSIIALHTRNLKKLAKDYIFKFDFKTAEEKYEELVLADTTNFDNTFEFAHFLANQNQHDKAIRYHLRALRLAKTEFAVANIQNNLGILYKSKNDYPSALSAYGKALEIRERLAKTNPATYEPDVATTQNNLGVLYKSKNDYLSALSAFGKALEIRERLTKTNPATYEPDVANIQNNLGILYKSKNDYLSALSAFGKALEIYERLAKTNPATYEPDVAMTQNNLGSLYQAKNDYPSALSAYGKALEIYERLTKTNPATYEPDVATTQNNLGILYKSKNGYPSALRAFGKALEIYERLAKTNPEAYEIELCRTIVLLGLLQKADYPQERQVQIDSYLNKAKHILSNYPDVPLAKTLLEYVTDLEGYFKVVLLYEEIQSAQKQIATLNTYAEKIKIQEKIIEEYRYLVANGYPKFANELGSSLSGLAWYQLFAKQFSQAELSAKEALSPTTFKKTESYDEKIEWANANLALALLFQGKYIEAEKIYLTLKDELYNKATYRETFLADLDELEKAGITHPDVVKIRELLKK